ncbi:biliverdin-producing heme oxygenase [Fluviispira vulneris]|uniref:biliverdin-producing heme oxygenase n=1 Tax=Fluviispira vulneris TaxID=2763012 RepID=UPI00164927D3|nr:biliverdin-producing heme oxygenase [Fluviispira vulneris]
MTTIQHVKNIHEMLRSATCQLHERVELINPLSKKEPSLEDYFFYLSAFLHLIEPIENNLSKFYVNFSFPKSDQSIKRSILLKNDLENLGMFQNIEFKSVIKTPIIFSAANAVGVLYVLEGSNLGGQFLYKKLKSLHGNKITHSLSFLYGNGFDTFKYWKEFLTFIQDYSDQHPSEIEIIIQSAIDTFECFEQMFLQNKN